MIKREVFKMWFIYFIISTIIGLPIIILIIVLLNSLFSVLTINSFLDTIYGFGLLLFFSFVIGFKISEHLGDELTKYIRNI